MALQNPAVCKQRKQPWGCRAASPSFGIRPGKGRGKVQVQELMTAGRDLQLLQNRLHGGRKKRQESELLTAQVSDLCRSRLLNYADTFMELARSYDREFFTGMKDRQAVLAERRLWENRQVIKGHLHEMAKIMTEIAGEVVCYHPMEEKKRRLLTQAMKEEGIRVENPCYIPKENGKEAVMATLSTDRYTGISGEEVADMISVLLDRRLKLSASSPYMVERTPHCFVLEEEASFLVLTGFARAAKENETISGDNYSVLEEDAGRIILMLSDGTGSGEQAGKDSGQVLDLMEKMLEAGYETEAAIYMVNAALFALGEDQNHPTLDLCDIDLHQGSLELHKAGGAVSFLKRDTLVEQLATGTLPLGIFQKVDAQPLCRTLQDGDCLVMVTDGVIDAFCGEEYEKGLVQMLSRMQEVNPEEMAERILRMALVACGGRIRDDMTVGVAGIWKP